MDAILRGEIVSAVSTRWLGSSNEQHADYKFPTNKVHNPTEFHFPAGDVWGAGPQHSQPKQYLHQYAVIPRTTVSP